MRLSRLFLFVSTLATLSACTGTGKVDSSFPTVAEQDRLDAQWGLPQRTSRGAPKRTYQYNAPSPAFNTPVTPASSTPVPPRETVNTPPPASATVDPAAIDNLR